MKSRLPHLPKLLVASAFPPGAASGSWPMLEQLLKDWPRESVVWWSMDFPINEEVIGGIRTMGPGNTPKKLIPHFRWTQLKCFLLEQTCLRRAASHLQRTIEQEKPDVIWMIPHVFSIPVFHEVMRHHHSRHLHVSIHDMVDLKHASQTLGDKRLARYKKQLEEIYQHADSRDVVTVEMEDDFFQSTGKKANVIVKFGAELEQINDLRSKSWRKPEEKIQIGYAGTIIAEDAFALFVRALQQIRHQLPLPVEIHLFSGHEYRDRSWYDESLIVRRGFLKGEEFKNEYQKCHWALVLADLDTSNHRYSGYSIPCKFTHSMALGIPLLCIANDQSTLFKMVDRYHSGILFRELTVDAVAATLLHLFQAAWSQPDLFARMAELLDQECNAERNRDKILNCFLY